jgi:hypothetical protein
LPLSLSNFVFCQYSFWNHPESIVVPPVVNPEYPVTCSSGRDSMTFKFDHHHDFDIPVTEEFLEHCSGKLSSSNISAVCAQHQATRPVHLSVSYQGGITSGMFRAFSLLSGVKSSVTQCRETISNCGNGRGDRCFQLLFSFSERP